MGKRVNTTVKERKALLKELGYTEDEMQKFYDDAAKVNSKIKVLKDTGHKWTDLTVYQMRQLPGLMERTLEQLEKEAGTEEEVGTEKEREQQEMESYSDEYGKNILKKIDAGEKLTKEELNTLVHEYEYDKEASADVYKNTRSVTTVVRLGDEKDSRFFSIDWIEDISVFGESMFDSQPCEVVQVYDMVKVKKWVDKSTADQFEKEARAENEAGTEITADTIDKIINYMAHHCISCNIDKLTQSEIIEMREYLKEHARDIK